ncbi:hypothetical protein J6590_070253 [Homalodisca vitripennis]|nr:hypothetical protein J6590_070253 [Homalodisca vitripennis]
MYLEITIPLQARHCQHSLGKDHLPIYTHRNVLNVCVYWRGAVLCVDHAAPTGERRDTRQVVRTDGVSLPPVCRLYTDFSFWTKETIGTTQGPVLWRTASVLLERAYCLVVSC